MKRRGLVACFGVLGALVLQMACQAECVTLARRICYCQRSEDPSIPHDQVQQRCLAELQVQQNSVQVTDEDNERCAGWLDTCDCTDIDENRVEECGYTR